MVVGVIKVWAGYALIQGRTWARILTIALCFFHAIIDMVTLTTQPILGLVFIAFNIIILYAVTVKLGRSQDRHGGLTRKGFTKSPLQY